MNNFQAIVCYFVHDLKYFCHMANSVSRENEPNPVLWLATQAGEMELSCTLGIMRCVP